MGGIEAVNFSYGKISMGKVSSAKSVKLRINPRA